MGPHLTGGNTIEAAPRRPSKRILTDLEADKAATEITDLVEQEGHHIIGSKRRLSNSEQGKLACVCVCVCLFSAIRPHAFLSLSFLLF